jgi:uncharacterized membrane protein
MDPAKDLRPGRIVEDVARMTPKIVKQARAQPRLVTAVLLGVLLWSVLPWPQSTRLLAAWDCSTALYLVMALAMMAGSSIDKIRVRAARQDEGQAVILALTTITALVSLAGVMVELAFAKTFDGHEGWRHIALAGVTVLFSWAFLHTMFAVHYAHEYYTDPEQGLEFPGNEPPDYWDFMYYSFVIGTACATADVNITDKRMRKITTLHCIVAFFFNTTILALTVNIGAGFF